MKKELASLALSLLLNNLTFADATNLSIVSEKEFNTLKQEIKILKEQVSLLTKSKSDVTTAFAGDYIKNGDCTALTTQPSNTCNATNKSYCYPVSDFNDADGNNLAGYTFIATKTTLDYVNRDGGVWLCDNSVVQTPLINHCRKIGGNAHTRGPSIVEFTIPSGTVGTPLIIAPVMNTVGAINITSALSAFSICKQATSTTINP